MRLQEYMIERQTEEQTQTETDRLRNGKERS